MPEEAGHACALRTGPATVWGRGRVCTSYTFNEPMAETGSKVHSEIVISIVRFFLLKKKEKKCDPSEPQDMETVCPRTGALNQYSWCDGKCFAYFNEVK